MNSLLAVLAASLTTFAATNIDDVFILTLFFARRVPTRRIVAGRYLGFAAIILVSLIGVWAALAIPHRWIRLRRPLPLSFIVRVPASIARTGQGKRENFVVPGSTDFLVTGSPIEGAVYD